MADIADNANKEIDAFNESTFRAYRKNANSPLITNSKCEACGEPIPTERQKAIPGVRFCVTCQERFENEHN